MRINSRWWSESASVCCAVLLFSVSAKGECEADLWQYLHNQKDLSSAVSALKVLPSSAAELLSTAAEGKSLTVLVATDAAYLQSSLAKELQGSWNYSDAAGIFLSNTLPVSEKLSSQPGEQVFATFLAEALANSSYSLVFITQKDGGVLIRPNFSETSSAAIVRSTEVCGSWVHVLDTLLIPPSDAHSASVALIKGSPHRSSNKGYRQLGIDNSKDRESAAQTSLLDSLELQSIGRNAEAGVEPPGGSRRMLQGQLRKLPSRQLRFLLGGIVGSACLVAVAVSMLSCFWRQPRDKAEKAQEMDEEEERCPPVQIQPVSSLDFLFKSLRLKTGIKDRRCSPPTSGSSRSIVGTSGYTGSSSGSARSPYIGRGSPYQVDQQSPQGFIPSSQLAEQMRQQSMVSCESLDDEYGTGASIASLRSVNSSWEMNSWELDAEEVQICLDSRNRPWQLGCGGFGRVFRAEMAGSTPVAVKFVTRQSPRELRRFVHEISILKSLRHTNIVQFLGAFLEGGQMVLVTEYMVGGDLYNVMGHDLDRSFGWYKRGQQVALDVVRGVVHMHSRKIIHLDLKSANILLARDGTAKIADVGLAKVLSREITQVSMESTFDWAAPEVLAGNECSEKADIWSLGVVLWEIVSGEAPKLRQLRPLRVPEECPQEVRNVIVACRASTPADRPTAREVFNKLSAVINPDAPRPASSILSSPLRTSFGRPSWAAPEHAGGEENPTFMACIHENVPSLELGKPASSRPLGWRQALEGLPPRPRDHGPTGQSNVPPAWVKSHRPKMLYHRATSL